MDEKSMILEQERQQKARKRKKYKKLKWIAGILVLVLVASGIWYAVQGRYLLAENDNGTVEIVAGDGQEIVYARIDSINGNEVSYTVVDMTAMNVNQTQDSEESSQRGGMGEGQMPDKGNMDFSGMSEGQMPDMGSKDFSGMSEGQMPDKGNMDFSGMSEGQMPDKGNMDFSGMSEGQMPDMSDMDFSGMSEGQMPDMGSKDFSGMSEGQMPDMSNMDFSGMEEGQMPDMGNKDFSDMSEGQKHDRTNAEAGKGERPDGGEKRPTDDTSETEAITTYIPVGTEVTTKLGTVTTFSRLAVGDYVAFIMEQDGDEQIIMAVYIVG